MGKNLRTIETFLKVFSRSLNDPKRPLCSSQRYSSTWEILRRFRMTDEYRRSRTECGKGTNGKRREIPRRKDTRTMDVLFWRDDGRRNYSRHNQSPLPAVGAQPYCSLRCSWWRRWRARYEGWSDFLRYRLMNLWQKRFGGAIEMFSLIHVYSKTQYISRCCFTTLLLLVHVFRYASVM